MTQEAHRGFLHNGCQSEERKMEKNIMLHGSYIKGNKWRPSCTNHLHHIEYQFLDVEFEARLP